MTTSLVQQTLTIGSSASSPTTATFFSSPAKGDLIVVGIVFVTNVPTVISLTDSNGNNYSLAGSTVAGGAGQTLIYSAIATGGARGTSDVITLVWSGAGSANILAAEYSGPWPTPLLDNSASVVSSGTSISYNLLARSKPELVVTLNSASSSVTWSGLTSGAVDRFGLTGSIEYNDITANSISPLPIVATLSSSATFFSLSVSFFQITAPTLVSSFAIDDILSIVNDELHGKKNAFAETQKIRHINKALDEMWKIMKTLHQGYWLTNNTPGLVLDIVNTDFILPPDFAEVRLIEVTNPIDYVGIDVVRMYMNSGIFKSERESFRAAQTIATSDSVLVIPGQLNYDIYGPDISSQMHILFSRPAPVPLTLLIWYIQLVGHFSVPKNSLETLQTLLSPYIWDLAVYAAKSLLKSEGTDQGEFAKWESEWSKGIDRSMPAAHERATADEDTVEGFVEL